MSSALAIRAGQAFVEVFANTNKLAAGLRQAQTQVQAFASKAQSIGMAMARVGMAGVSPLAAATKTFADFEQQMATVKAVVQPTAQEFAALTDEALRIGRDTVYSSSDAAQAMVYFARAGFTVQEMLAATGPVVNLAASNMMSMEQATTAVIPVLRGMGLQAVELTRVMDVLNAAANAAFTDVSLLSSGFAYVAADAKAAGLSLEDTAAFLAVLSNAGIRGEKAGTGLRAMLADFKQLTPGAAAQLKQLGVVLHDANNNWRPTIEILDDLREKTKGMGSFAKDQALARIFDVRSGSAATASMQSLREYYELRQKISNSAGTTDRMSATTLNTVTGSWKMLTSSVEGFAIAVGKGLAPVLRGWSDTLVSITNRLSAWADANPEVYQSLLKLSVTLVAGGAALTAFGLAIGAVAPLLGLLATAIALPFKVFLAAGWKQGLLRAALAMASFTQQGRAAWSDFGAVALRSASEIAAAARRLWSDLQAVAQGLGDALVIGDWDAAWKMAMLGVQVAWAEMWAQMQGASLSSLDAIGGAILNTFTGLFAGILKLNATLWKEVGLGWEMLKETLSVGISLDGKTAKQRMGETAAEWDKWEAGKFKEIDKMSATMSGAISSGLAAERGKNYKGVGTAGKEYRDQIDALGFDLSIKRFVADMDGMVDQWLKGLEAKAGTADAAAKSAGKGGLGGIGGGESVGTFMGYLAGQLGPTSINEQIADNTKRAADALDGIKVGIAAGMAFQ
ncbi:MAG: phage tail tape measure protein [Gemmataceae bacterium]